MKISSTGLELNKEKITSSILDLLAANPNRPFSLCEVICILCDSPPAELSELIPQVPCVVTAVGDALDDLVLQGHLLRTIENGNVRYQMRSR